MSGEQRAGWEGPPVVLSLLHSPAVSEPSVYVSAAQGARPERGSEGRAGRTQSCLPSKVWDLRDFCASLLYPGAQRGLWLVSHALQTAGCPELR